MHLIQTPPEPSWLAVARAELGVREVPGAPANARIIHYHSFTKLKATSDETPWCSSFICFAFSTVGMPHTESARALSWLAWGVPSKAALGAVAVISYGKGKGHVGLVAGRTPDKKIVLLGGNQSDGVRYAAKAEALITGFRLPKDYPEILNLPELQVAPGGLDLAGTR